MFKEKAIVAYPDGWSCVNCGDEYTEKTIDADCFYVIETKQGTECLKCSMNNERK
jgi:hypothetical protein